MNTNKSRRALMLITAVVFFAVIGAVAPIYAQDLICCNQLIIIDRTPPTRDCRKRLGELPAAARAKACSQLRGCCPMAAELCGNPSLNCTSAPRREGGPTLPNPSPSPSDSPNPPSCSDSTVNPTITIDLEDTLNIDETPKMPEINATATVSPETSDVTWEAKITYKLRFCSGPTPNLDSPVVTGQGETFTPDFGDIYGGTLEIKAKTNCGMGAETTITREIGGRNAPPSEVSNEIGTMDSPFQADDLKKIACHESNGQLQFAASNKPTLGATDDVGIMQICYARTLGDVWNWKTNIASGRAKLLEAASFSRGVPRMVRRRSVRGMEPFPDATDFTADQLRLEAIKRYNAGNAADVGYWEWDNAAGEWVPNPQGGGDPDYVDKVLAANCP